MTNNRPPPVQSRFKNLCQEFYLEAHQTLSLTLLSCSKPFSYSKTHALGTTVGQQPCEKQQQQTHHQSL